jgi:hypothetical protein
VTNTQLYLAIGLPTLAVITSLVINIVTISGIRSEMGELRSDVRSEMGDIRSGIRDDLGDMRSGIRTELADIRSDIREIRADIKLMTGKLAEMDTRISVIEERLKI